MSAKKSNKDKIKDATLKVLSFLFIGFILVNMIQLFSFSKEKTDEKSDEKTYAQRFNEDYRIYAVPLPKKLDFAGEAVPLDNFDVREALDREFLVNIYWQSQTLLFLKKANRYFPKIEEILKKYGVPDDFKYLALIESGLTNVVSPAGATGIWQFMRASGKEFGLEINKEVDERYHFEKSTEAACKYILKAYEKFGNWTLAAASYNVGKRGVSKQIKRQKQNSFYDLLLNEETSRYIYRTLAIKCIMENPQKYGFNYRKEDLYPVIETTKIKVDSAVGHWADFAKNYDLSYKIIKYFNPWLRQVNLTNTAKKTYYITIPQNRAIYKHLNQQSENSTNR